MQIVVGDWAAQLRRRHTSRSSSPRWRGCSRPSAGAPLHLGGSYVDGELRYAVEIPNGLSLLAHYDPDAEIIGPGQVPAGDRPPVNVVHLVVPD